ncbi:MAG: 50S ribosomal protein L9 [Candidatus Magasanikbacteria bacterium RIFOXYD2_FULL_36_9]|uniref:Large ribosomal subunit protein bL9 n=1 Tax=Candidatus Magasanikbacteria bacterium RIFOXYD2_FULL_36_9 TaxID=1798707 RepID=A0A1F6NYY9_9BACT|nr:MAG: 50S ribosomal protein L9 [Candidatus Magasanikbacteria bacterium RIFOXYD2_FULL_36_9]
MQVVLLQDVKGVGKADEIKDVSEGYARNFLFPKHLAVQALDKNIKELGERKRKESKESERELQELQGLAGRLDELEIVVKEKASETGLLYASVGPQRLAQDLQKRGFKVTKNQIQNLNIKKAGEYRVKVKLNHGLEAQITVRVETL